jgi:hypothetical protein
LATDSRKLRVIDQLSGKPGTESLELGPDGVGLADLARGRPAHHRAAVGDEHDGAAGLKDAQGLADRHAAHAEALGQLLLAQA